MYVAQKKIIERVLQRKRKKWRTAGEVDMKEMLRSILKWANEFVPSKSGSILLDDPVLNSSGEKSGRLYFVTCFGKGSNALTGTHIPDDAGIAGKTYTTGKPYISRNVEKDENFFKDIDKKTKQRTMGIICVPILIRGVTVGVLELINRVDRINYEKKDLTLLKIFAGYTSTLIQNSLDAKKYAELSISDNLTGLYNDRYFYVRLSREVRKSVRKDCEMSLVFLDLDRFKEVNDTHGHLTGSHLLTEVGSIIREHTDSSTVPVRYGGDEFAIILAGKDIASAKKFAEELREDIESHVFLKKGVPPEMKPLNIKGLITASFGVASLKKNVGTEGSASHLGDTLIKAADTAMYASKNNGKNRVSTARGMRKNKK